MAGGGVYLAIRIMFFLDFKIHLCIMTWHVYLHWNINYSPAWYVPSVHIESMFSKGTHADTWAVEVVGTQLSNWPV